VRGIYHFVWVPRIFTKYFQMKKVPAWVQIHFLIQRYKGLTKLPSRRVISSPEEEKRNSGLHVSQGQKLPC
jgi:hypothetical protein